MIRSYNKINEKSVFTSYRESRDFDNNARGRMTYGTYQISSMMQKYIREDSVIYEIGPYESPLAKPNNTNKVCFIDADKTALRKLETKYADYLNVSYFNYDLNKSLKKINQTWIKVLSVTKLYPTDIIISQVLNYLDFRNLLYSVSCISRTGTMLYINNVVDYGIPEIFSNKRPKSNEDIYNVLYALGWEVLKKEIVQSCFEEQSHNRLLLAVRKR